MKMTLKRSDWRIQTLLWFTYGLLIYYWFQFPMSAEIARWHALRLLLIHIFIFYVNTSWLLPRFFARHKYLIYVILIILLLILVYYLFIWTFDIMPTDRVAAGRFRGGRMRLNRWILPNMGWSFLILFFSTIYWVTEQFRKKQSEEKEFRNESLSMEMKLLKSQINPHFLFNALNNIYSFSLTDREKTPDMILKLSEMLRYVLYESNVERVSLEREVWYLQNYIDFQRIKFEHPPNLAVDLPAAPPPLRIAPMLLLPFVENAFKHSDLDDQGNGWLSIELTLEENQVYFAVKNSLPQSTRQKDTTGGIGIENVSRRLSMLYPDKHRLVISEKERTFSVTLDLTLS